MGTCFKASNKQLEDKQTYYKSLEALRSWAVWKDVIYTLFKVKIFTVATKLKSLARTPFEMGLRAQPYFEGENIVFSNQFGTCEAVSRAARMLTSSKASTAQVFTSVSNVSRHCLIVRFLVDVSPKNKQSFPQKSMSRGWVSLVVSSSTLNTKWRLHMHLGWLPQPPSLSQVCYIVLEGF